MKVRCIKGIIGAFIGRATVIENKIYQVIDDFSKTNGTYNIIDELGNKVNVQAIDFEVIK